MPYTTCTMANACLTQFPNVMLGNLIHKACVINLWHEHINILLFDFGAPISIGPRASVFWLRASNEFLRLSHNESEGIFVDHR